MPGNIEIKAKVKSMPELMEKARAIAEMHIPLQQCDTFFNALKPGCRLKLRFEEVLSDGGKQSACLVAYERPDMAGPKFSHYVLTPVSDPSSMTEALEMSNGTIGKVEKKRDAFIVKRGALSARVHLDVVKDLGDFLEFEVIVNDDSEMAEANSFAEYLSTYFNVTEEDRIAGAYWNLLQERKS